MLRSTISTAGVIFAVALLAPTIPSTASGQEATMVRLPRPNLDGMLSVESALQKRRSVRELGGPALTLEEIGQLLWAAQGVTRPLPEPEGWQYGQWAGGLRTAPSAGALYPLELYLVAVDVQGLDPGVYHYEPLGHGLTRHTDADPDALASAALGQRPVSDAPASLVMTADYQRTAVKYGDRSRRYVQIEIGAAAENVYLQAEALGLGTVLIGAFHDDRVHRALDLPTDHAPLAIMPIGRRR